MSSHSAHAADPGGDGNNNEMDKKVAGFVVFSGIAMSILKAAVNPFFKNTSSSTSTSTSTRSSSNDDEIGGTIPAPNLKIETQTHSNHTHSPPPCCQHPPLQQPIFESPVTTPVEQNVVEFSAKTVEIVKGDTLWGLSREYGVSIEAIKEANGLTGDTIYAGKKLIIP